MSEYFGQHRENDWKLWNLPQFLSIPPEDVGVWGIPFAKRCDQLRLIRKILPRSNGCKFIENGHRFVNSRKYLCFCFFM